MAGSSVIALDVGDRRIGIAVASLAARLAGPLTTLERGDNPIADITALLKKEDAAMLVIGLPRGLDGQETAQTRSAQAFGFELAKITPIPVFWQDEALTSVRAEKELDRRGKPYCKGDIDALAATYILEDFLREHPNAGAAA
jgi:putative Holliday junction resolvase